MNSSSKDRYIGHIEIIGHQDLHGCLLNLEISVSVRGARGTDLLKVQVAGMQLMSRTCWYLFSNSFKNVLF